MSYLPITLQSVTPLTGTTVTISEASNNVVLDLNPAGTLAELTIVFPSTGVPTQVLNISTTQDITVLNLVNVDYGAITSAVAGDCMSFLRVSSARIHRITM